MPIFNASELFWICRTGTGNARFTGKVSFAGKASFVAGLSFAGKVWFASKARFNGTAFSSSSSSTPSSSSLRGATPSYMADTRLQNASISSFPEIVTIIRFQRGNSAAPVATINSVPYCMGYRIITGNRIKWRFGDLCAISNQIGSNFGIFLYIYSSFLDNSPKGTCILLLKIYGKNT
ncbi:hypothetical protein BGX38DRAFT_714046 [Terfezia claveryi]|nr:hypothetical protein BGX38DRAFT_714046 [Terfezia claveryi]